VGRRFIAAGVTISAILFASLSSSAAAAGTGLGSATSADNPTQTLGTATLYGTSAPLGLTAAPR
jgi:hypothetical protein